MRPTPFCADVERVLRPTVAGALALELPVGFLSVSAFSKAASWPGEDQALLGHLGFERLEALLHRLQIMALPHPAHARRRDGVPLFAHLVGDPDLAEGGLIQREREDGGLDLGRRAGRQQGLTTGELLKGEPPPVS